MAARPPQSQLRERLPVSGRGHYVTGLALSTAVLVLPADGLYVHVASIFGALLRRFELCFCSGPFISIFSALCINKYVDENLFSRNLRYIYHKELIFLVRTL